MKQQLPILGFENLIVSTVFSSAVTIVTAETGAGKSTQVPQFLVKAGYRVVVTEPRVLAARTLAMRVSEEMGVELGTRVGYATAEERKCSAQTQILYCTDGLQLVREIAGAGRTGGRTILVLDEVHEWNLNMEVLIAWAKSRIMAGDDLKVVIMSATIDAQGLANFYGPNTPVISVPGRLFPVEKKTLGADYLVAEASALARAGHNVLVFLPGKSEIYDTVADLERELGNKSVVLPLHGDLKPEEQQKCFDEAPSGISKIVVATNVAQTSITIPDIDAVVDSGEERRMDLDDDGIEGLYLRSISRADCEQRAGRAGRTKAGKYVLCSSFPMEDRKPYPTAEILSRRVDQLVLRLAVQGIDATELEFFHQPNQEVLKDARRTLVALGAMTDQGAVTAIGRRMEQFPINVAYARMVVEAIILGVVEPVVTIAACLEAGEIRSKKNEWRQLTTERSSDLLAILDVWRAGKLFRSKPGQSKAEVLCEAGIFARDFYRADSKRRKLFKVVPSRYRIDTVRYASTQVKREAILKACIAGLVDHLYHRDGYSGYRNSTSTVRHLDQNSVVVGQNEWLVGLPKDIEVKTKFGTRMLHLIVAASVVDPVWLAEIAPQLVEKRSGNYPIYDPEQDAVVSTFDILFNGHKIGEEQGPDSTNPQAAYVFREWLADKLIKCEVQERARSLNVRVGRNLFKVMDRYEIKDMLKSKLSDEVRCLKDIKKERVLSLPELDPELSARVLHDYPDTITVDDVELKVEYGVVSTYGQFGVSSKHLVTLPGIEFISKLSESGLVLPGGYRLYIRVNVGHTSFEERNVLLLQGRVSEYLNKELFEELRYSRSISLPDPLAERFVVPFEIAVFGQCPMTGEDLKAYGTCIVNRGRFARDPWIRFEWFRDLVKAHNAADELAANLDSIRQMVIEEKAELERQEKMLVKARAEADTLLAELQTLARHDDRQYLPAEYQHELTRMSEGNPPYGLEDLRFWNKSAKRLVASIKTALAELAKRREDLIRSQEAAARREQQKAEAAARRMNNSPARQTPKSAVPSKPASSQASVSLETLKAKFNSKP